jgi:two-component system response regulator HupR/HoxA
MRGTQLSPVDYHAFPLLVVDDEPEILRTFEFNYRHDFTILTACGADEALHLVREHDIALVLADQRMPGQSGVDLLTAVRALRPESLRLILTGYTDMDTLVRGVNDGQIYRYITKPWDSAELRVILRQAFETFVLARTTRLAHERLIEENRYLRRREVETALGAHGMLGSTPAMARVFGLIDRVRDAPTPVLIQGETGTGKELVARALHFGGAYRERLFVAQNCGALTESLLESELFGHRRGAFTGANADKKGLFELADEGTLFLDEISETTPAFQVKILRVLEEGEVRAVGDMRARHVNVRVVAASNRDLGAEVAAGRFRADLFYRLNVFPISVPPLRERRDDIPVLAAHFVARHAERLRRRIDGITPVALAMLTAYDYPGNVRELENELERAVLLCDEGEPITEDLVSERIVAAYARAQHANGQPAATLAGMVAEFERGRIVEMLATCDGNKSEAARRFGLTYRGLLAKMQRLGLA